MNTHIFLPTLTLDELTLTEEQAAWLTVWLQELETHVAAGDVAASLCLQGAISEIALHDGLRTDWLGIMDEYLKRDGNPIAYSEEYGKRLYNFADWIQTEVHAIHARWWIEKYLKATPSLDYVELIERLIQPSHWIYNPAVSQTAQRKRMKSEYLMSLAMGVEILSPSAALDRNKVHFEAVLSAEPLTGYLSAEYFRQYALQVLDKINLAPTGIDAVINSCEVGEGYCDFDVRAKVDDYMGTAKRISRDIPVHSAISSLHALSLSELCDETEQERVRARVVNFGTHLTAHPLDIQPFKMRDIEAPFGTGLSPLEIVAASGITLLCGRPTE
jgi:hypothetical protein